MIGKLRYVKFLFFYTALTPWRLPNANMRPFGGWALAASGRIFAFISVPRSQLTDTSRSLLAFGRFQIMWPSITAATSQHPNPLKGPGGASYKGLIPVMNVFLNRKVINSVPYRKWKLLHLMTGQVSPVICYDTTSNIDTVGFIVWPAKMELSPTATRT